MKIKAYTDIEQSQALAKILPIASADMRYAPFGDTHPWFIEDSLIEIDSTLCWSLTALMNVIKGKLCHYDGSYYCQFIDEGEDFPTYSTSEYDNPIDACVEMIVKLHSKELL